MYYYAGIGSRQTPETVLCAFYQIGKELARKGFVLRSGRADGADSYFEEGARDTGGTCEIFLPWKGFRNNCPLSLHPGTVFDDLSGIQKERALASVRRYHPNPAALSKGALKLMARNYCQLFGTGQDSSPSSFVICYTADGKASGGTGQAIRMAQDASIPVFNAHGFERDPAGFVRIIREHVEGL